MNEEEIELQNELSNELNKAILNASSPLEMVKAIQVWKNEKWNEIEKKNMEISKEKKRIVREEGDIRKAFDLNNTNHMRVKWLINVKKYCDQEANRFYAINQRSWTTQQKQECYIQKWSNLIISESDKLLKNIITPKKANTILNCCIKKPRAPQDTLDSNKKACQNTDYWGSTYSCDDFMSRYCFQDGKKTNEEIYRINSICNCLASPIEKIPHCFDNNCKSTLGHPNYRNTIMESDGCKNINICEANIDIGTAMDRVDIDFDSVQNCNQTHGDGTQPILTPDEKKEQEEERIKDIATRKITEIETQNETQNDDKLVPANLLDENAASTNIQKPSTNIQKPSTNIQKPSTNIQKPSTNIQKPSTTQQKATPQVNNNAINCIEKTCKIEDQICPRGVPGTFLNGISYDYLCCNGKWQLHTGQSCNKFLVDNEEDVGFFEGILNWFKSLFGTEDFTNNLNKEGNNLCLKKFIILFMIGFLILIFMNFR